MQTHSAFLMTAVWPAEGQARWVRDVVLVLAGTALVAFSAQILIPFWPVPFTGQTFAVLLIGAAYGWRLGGVTLLAYLAEGAIGIPVFAKAQGGLAVLGGPTGGYLVGFVFAATLVGWLAERGWDRHIILAALAMLIGNIVIYVFGVPMLALFYAGPGQEYVAATGASSPFGAAIAEGLLKFIYSDLLKLALAASALPLAWRLMRRGRG